MVWYYFVGWTFFYGRDMSNNSLTVEIPEFLGVLPNLAEMWATYNFHLIDAHFFSPKNNILYSANVKMNFYCFFYHEGTWRATILVDLYPPRSSIITKSSWCKYTNMKLHFNLKSPTFDKFWHYIFFDVYECWAVVLC